MENQHELLQLDLEESVKKVLETIEREQAQNTVQVVNKEGEQLASCKPKRARLLLERGDATVTQFVPFTIQLTKETGETNEHADILLPKGSVNACVSAIGQARTAFLLQQALHFAKDNHHVLFISTIVYEHALNTMIQQFITKEDYPYLPNIQIESTPSLSINDLTTKVETIQPTIVILDDWVNKESLCPLAHQTNCVIWHGTTSRFAAKERMPTVADIRAYTLAENASLIVGLYGNQAGILKNRFGTNGQLGIHQQHIRPIIE